MFKKPLHQPHQRVLRNKEESLLQERLQPDGRRHAGWLRKLTQRLAEAHPQVLVPELFVPEGRLALLLQDGQPGRWFQPGRHQLSPAKAKVEVRLISTEILPDQHRGRLDLTFVLGLPYERALLFVDGVQVAIVKPGEQPASTSREHLQRSRHGSSAPMPAQNLPHAVAADGEEELSQDFSFV